MVYQHVDAIVETDKKKMHQEDEGDNTGSMNCPHHSMFGSP